MTPLPDVFAVCCFDGDRWVAVSRAPRWPRIRSAASCCRRTPAWRRRRRQASGPGRPQSAAAASACRPHRAADTKSVVLPSRSGAMVRINCGAGMGCLHGAFASLATSLKCFDFNRTALPCCWSRRPGARRVRARRARERIGKAAARDVEFQGFLVLAQHVEGDFPLGDLGQRVSIAAHFRRGLPSISSPMDANNCSTSRATRS